MSIAQPNKKLNTYSVQFQNEQLAQDVLLSKSYFSNSSVPTNNRSYLFPMITPTEKKKLNALVFKLLRTPEVKNHGLKDFTAGHNSIKILNKENGKRICFRSKAEEDSVTFLKANLESLLE